MAGKGAGKVREDMEALTALWVIQPIDGECLGGYIWIFRQQGTNAPHCILHAKPLFSPDITQAHNRHVGIYDAGDKTINLVQPYARKWVRIETNS